MDKKTKILLIILTILIILLVGYVTYIFAKNKNQQVDSKIGENITTENITEKNETENEIENEQNKIEENNSKETTENNESSEENTEKPINSNIKESYQNTTNNNNNGKEIVGKEEQESNNENSGVNPEEIAIKLAKEKWGETSESYVFTIDQIEGKIYHVAVNSNAQVIGYIDVNIETKTAVERQKFCIKILKK